MAYYDALISEWSTIANANPSFTTDQKLAAINAMTVAGPMVDVTVQQVTGYLSLNLKLAPLISYANSPPSGAIANSVMVAQNLVAVFNLPQPPVFGTSNSQIYSTLNGALSILSSDPLSNISNTDIVALMGLANTTLPWWQENDYSGPFNYNDLTAAGGLV